MSDHLAPVQRRLGEVCAIVDRLDLSLCRLRLGQDRGGEVAISASEAADLLARMSAVHGRLRSLEADLSGPMNPRAIWRPDEAEL